MKTTKMVATAFRRSNGNRIYAKVSDEEYSRLDTVLDIHENGRFVNTVSGTSASDSSHFYYIMTIRDYLAIYGIGPVLSENE